MGPRTGLDNMGKINNSSGTQTPKSPVSSQQPYQMRYSGSNKATTIFKYYCVHCNVKQYKDSCLIEKMHSYTKLTCNLGTSEGRNSLHNKVHIPAFDLTCVVTMSGKKNTVVTKKKRQVRI